MKEGQGVYVAESGEKFEVGKLVFVQLIIAL